MTTTIDKAGSRFYTDTAGQGVSGTVYIREIKWVGDQASGKDIAATDDFLVSDSYGTRIVGKRAISDGDDFKDGPYNPGIPSEGFTVTTMDGGVCYITFERA
jgi:hypothetical protein